MICNRHRRSIKEDIDFFLEDDDTWYEFIDDWIERNQDDVRDIVSLYMERQIQYPNTEESEEWYHFCEDKAIARCEDAMEERYERQREAAWEKANKA